MNSPPDTTITLFKHEPLPDAANHMRLLEVLDSNYSDTIKVYCRITTWSSLNLPSYHAISYAWGDPRSNTTILINGKPLSVRKNCEFVMKQASWHAKSRYYWVDAICIDQENLNEKGKQVAMMGNIYKRADHVLACVGNHTEDSLFLFRNLDRFSPFVNESSPDDKTLILRLYCRFGFFTIRRFIRACMNFPNRPYFSRLWVMQELKNARQTSLLCGRDSTSGEEFGLMFFIFMKQLWRKAQKPTWKIFTSILKPDAIHEEQMSRISEKITSKTLAKDFIENEPLIYRMLFLLSKEIDPIGLVLFSRHLECSVPKDKVYGIISVLDSGDHAPIVPDYNKSDFQVALDLLHAIWISEFVQKQDSGSQLILVCANTIENLHLHRQNPFSVLKALVARRSPPGEEIKEAEMRPKNSLPPAPSFAIGCRVLDDNLTQGDDGLYKSWNPPGAKNIKVFLPYWTQGDDWVVHIKEQFRGPGLFLVLREEAKSSRMRILGHGCASNGPLNLIGTTFKILWEPEDILLCTLVYLVLSESTEHCEEWRKALTTRVCRRTTPGSSYGVKLPQE